MAYELILKPTIVHHGFKFYDMFSMYISSASLKLKMPDLGCPWLPYMNENKTCLKIKIQSEVKQFQIIYQRSLLPVLANWHLKNEKLVNNLMFESFFYCFLHTYRCNQILFWAIYFSPKYSRRQSTQCAYK